MQPIAGDQYRDRAKPVQTCGAAGDPAIANRTACAPEPGAADANTAIEAGPATRPLDRGDRAPFTPGSRRGPRQGSRDRAGLPLDRGCRQLRNRPPRPELGSLVEVIGSPPGNEIYFHRNSVTNGGFDKLAVGDEVRFVAQDS